MDADTSTITYPINIQKIHQQSQKLILAPFPEYSTLGMDLILWRRQIQPAKKKKERAKIIWVMWQKFKP